MNVFVVSILCLISNFQQSVEGAAIPDLDFKNVPEDNKKVNISTVQESATGLYSSFSDYVPTFANDTWQEIKKHGEVISTYLKPHLEIAKNGTQNAVENSEDWLSDFWKWLKPYIEKVEGYLPLWAWILIGVILLFVLYCFCLKSLIKILHCCGIAWCCGFRSYGVAECSCASCFQSCCYGERVPSGSCFSICQSVAMK